MWTDRETLVDLINVQHLVAAITETVKEEKLLPTTLGVFGDWGSGKSSLLSMAKQELDAQDGVACITFDGSLFEGYEDAKAALMSIILEEIRDQQPKESPLRTTANGLLKRVNWFRTAGFVGKGALSLTLGEPVLGMSAFQDLLKVVNRVEDFNAESAEDLIAKASVVGKELRGLVNPDLPSNPDTLRRSVSEFRKDFAELLEKSSINTLVVFIDELDRCTPDTVLETLQAIRLFLSVPGTAFVIGADERLVEHAVQVKFPLKPEEGRTLNIGRHYLEKIVHHPIRIPPLSEAEITTYMNLLFTSLHVEKAEFEAHCKRLLAEEVDGLDMVRFDLSRAMEAFGDLDQGKLNDLKEDLLLVEQTASVLATGLDGNPRQTKRFLNMLRQRLKMAARRKVTLKRQVLAKLMVLEYFRLERFRELAEWQAKQNGRPAELKHLEGRLKVETSEESAYNDEAVETLSNPEKVTNHGFPTFTDWTNDSWLQMWLANPPQLADVDLRPYYFFARERLNAQRLGTDQLSRPAKEIFELLLSSSEAEQSRALEKSKQLSPGDVAAVTQGLAAMVRRTEDLRSESSPLNRLLAFVGIHPEQLGEVTTLLRQLPTAQLSPGLPPKLATLATGKAAEPSVKALIASWAATEGNSPFQKASRMIQRREN